MDGEDHQAAQLLARTKDFINKVLQHRRGLDQATHSQHLELRIEDI